VAAAFPETDDNDAIGKWLLTLPSPQRERMFRVATLLATLTVEQWRNLFRLVEYLHPPKPARPGK